MKLAHLILAHHHPQLLGRLVKRLQHADADIFIHLDKKANMDDFKHLRDIPNTYFINERVKTGWGNYSIIQATLNGFEQILQTGNTYSHINLLSGQDYPLKPIAHIHRFLFANAGTTFMPLLDINNNEWEDGKARITSYSFGDYALPAKYKLQRLANAVLPKRKVPYGLKPYGCSQWLTITPECAQYTIDQLKARPRLKSFFRMTWAVDEVFFQTILGNSPLRNKVVNDNLRYIEDDPHKRPVIFTMADAGKLASTPKLFARKFDDDMDTAILDYLDTIIDTPAK